MSVLEQARIYLPDDLLRMSDGSRYELINGELVEKDMSALACYVAGLLFDFLHSYVKQHRLGIVFPDGTSYQCFDEKPEQVRRPDCSFIQASRFSLEDLQENGHVLVVPDLVAEVISTHDTVYEIDLRIADYLKAGVNVVWSLNPVQKTVAIHRRQGQGSIVGVKDDLLGEGPLQGLVIKVEELFALPDWLRAAKA